MEFERKQLHLAQATAHTPDGKLLQTTMNKRKDGCWKRKGHIWTLSAFEIPKLTLRLVAQDRPRHPHHGTH